MGSTGTNGGLGPYLCYPSQRNISPSGISSRDGRDGARGPPGPNFWTESQDIKALESISNDTTLDEVINIFLQLSEKEGSDIPPAFVQYNLFLLKCLNDTQRQVACSMAGPLYQEAAKSWSENIQSHE